MKEKDDGSIFKQNMRILVEDMLDKALMVFGKMNVRKNFEKYYIHLLMITNLKNHVSTF